MTLNEFRNTVKNQKIIVCDSSKGGCSAELTNLMIGSGMGALTVLEIDFTPAHSSFIVSLDIPCSVLNEWINYSNEYYESI